MAWIDLARRFAVPIAAGLLALILLVVLPGSCRRERTAEATARIEAGAGRAATANGRDAVATVGRAAERAATSDAITRTNHKEIIDAPGASARVDVAVRDAGIDGLCRRDAYRDDPRCGLRRAAPGGVEGGGHGGAAPAR